MVERLSHVSVASVPQYSNYFGATYINVSVCNILQRGRPPLMAAVSENRPGVVRVLVNECKCNKAARNQVNDVKQRPQLMQCGLSISQKGVMCMLCPAMCAL